MGLRLRSFQRDFSPLPHILKGTELPVRSLCSISPLSGTVKLENYNRNKKKKQTLTRNKKVILKNNKVISHQYSHVWFDFPLAAPRRDALAPAIRAVSYPLTSKPSSSTKNQQHQEPAALPPLTCTSPGTEHTQPTQDRWVNPLTFQPGQFEVTSSFTAIVAASVP